MRVSWRVLLLLALAGCQGVGEDARAKRMPRPPPLPEIRVPDGLNIAVTIGSTAAPSIDAARLRSTPSDFSDAERRAWKLPTLLGRETSAPGTQFAVTGAPTAALLLTEPATATEPQPGLMLNRRGDLVATMIAPNAPFPSFHGEGGRLGRPGDTTPHVPGVVRIVVTPPPRAKLSSPQK
jgi:hypothetical protein